MNFETVLFDGGKLTVNADFAELLRFNGIDSARKLWELDCATVKKILVQRSTGRTFLSTPDGNKLEVYLKRYTPPPLKERLKQAFSLKFRNFDALHEWYALRAFHRAGLDTMVPIAAAAPGKGCTCNLTLGITGGVKAEELFRNFTPENCGRKSALIEKTAILSGRMHAAGFAHQDFYLVHLLVRENEHDRVYPIDLQRLIIQKKLSRRWRVKDLGQLLFAARPYVSDQDLRRFWKFYCVFAGEKFYRDTALIKAIIAKADKIAAREAGRK
ncbi:MAG: lipopolysaccharide kinase InaA family protein [Victivallaceae bacterium]|nr:lipopolysaccharide kinase InaA family protein [Victivallaceae bacterium]